MGRPFLTSIPQTSRFVYNIRCRLAVVLLLLALFHSQHLYTIHRRSLAAKYSATSFYFNTELAYPRWNQSDQQQVDIKDELLANRVSWRILGEGWEGKVFAYKNNVIKTFTPGRSPFRNCAWGPDGDTWPTEIPASLLFGRSSEPSSKQGIQMETKTADGGFLPVITYFKASTSSIYEEWHLVTPLLAGGNLVKLSRALSQDTRNLSMQDLDTTYRPAFDRLLMSLDNLHTAGYCHDDIKPANIFVRDELHWVLGDLGNLREVFHPYHSSRLWRDNLQLEDCRANDVVRALKSYLSFLRMSMSDEGTFYADFFGGMGPLSSMFWSAISDTAVLSASELLRRSRTETPGGMRAPQSEESISSLGGAQMLIKTFPRHLTLSRTVDGVLATRMGEKIARFWAMTWFFGVPVSDRCGV